MHLPQAMGNCAYFLKFFGFIYIVTTLLPALVLLAGVEIAYRIRETKSGAH
ncbi:hypothetical protein PhaeoP97_00891 [Phaeobacter porticola]|uniref:Uncharacterized protein n=1 Tax=Phaeobacter porticola TaxID=1844006 RepID=A0A1L3I2J2_9RHOB|nr:hypothetical protein PhaeoP97_00891 [Phaeobacter porticola]